MHKFTFPIIATLTLCACNTNWDPSFMPASYTYHHEEYKSSPGRKAPDIGYEYTDLQNEENLTQWRYAVRDLLLKARAQDFNLPQTFNLKTDLSPNAFTNSFDYILREGLREYGYTLTQDKKTPVVFFSAFDPEYKNLMLNPPSARTYNGDMATHQNRDILKEKYNPEKIELVLGLVENNALTQDIRGQYELPLSGYEPHNYVDQYQNPLKKQNKCPLYCHENTKTN